MQGKVHVAIGMATTAALCVAYPKGVTFGGIYLLPEIMLLSATAGSYFPDIDNTRTHAGQQHKTASKVINKVGGGHRGITHSFIFPALIAVAAMFIDQYLKQYFYLNTLVLSIMAGFDLGWIMHIIADLFNGKGCPILMPLSKSKISVMDLPSDGMVPWIFAVVFSALIIFVEVKGVYL